ncbi:MAG: Rrf2 family transcriptional regulator [Bariatricus sp.]|nr:Rrf2 family transcriptional regulator [Bariatricus sp.]
MKVSKKARYALQALVDLTTNMKENPIPLAEIAGRQEMSFSYLEQVFHELKKAGVVKSMKGPRGGYMLAKPADQTTAEEIFNAVEEKFCIVEVKKEEKLDALQLAIRKLVWDQIDEDVIALLKNMTLADIAENVWENSEEVKSESDVDAAK